MTNIRMDSETFRVSAAERRLVEMLAQKWGVSRADAWRRALRETGEQLGLWPLPEKPDGKA